MPILAAARCESVRWVWCCGLLRASVLGLLSASVPPWGAPVREVWASLVPDSESGMGGLAQAEPWASRGDSASAAGSVEACPAGAGPGPSGGEMTPNEKILEQLQSIERLVEAELDRKADTLLSARESDRLLRMLKHTQRAIRAFHGGD